jgi:predicted glycosyltransferase
LYSHDTMGLGHIRRNVLIARTLVNAQLPASILLISGTREACSFVLPPGVDCLTLPALHKETGGAYQARSLDTSVEELIFLRAKAIAAALEAFEPDLLIVDKVPRGVQRELQPALELLRARGRTRCVLGLRDILDDPATVRSEWCDGALEEAVHDYYDAIWVYGDAAVYDQVREYDYPAAVAAKVRYTGYLMRPMRIDFPEIGGAELSSMGVSPADRIVLCMVGGGQDGTELAEAFAQVDFPEAKQGVILTGPFMPPEVQQRLCRLAAGKPRLRVLKFVTDPDLLLSLAERVIAMGGYNTVCEVLSFHKRALIVPRMKPRREQFIRAERLHQLGLLDMLPFDQVNPRALADWLACNREPPQPVHKQVDFDGATNLPRLVEEVLTATPRARSGARPERRFTYAAP